MKRTTIGFVVTILAVVFFGLFNTVSATLDADSVNVFPKAEIPPVIDGEMDVVWYGATNLVMEKLVSGYEIDDWFDIWGKCKMLWDDTNLYLYMTVHDEFNQPEATNTYEQDGVEFFFDANLSQADAFDGVDDIQLRFNTQWEPDGATYPEGGFGTGTAWEFDRTGVDWKVILTDLGYVLEVCIPLANLQMEGAEGWDFGFEIQINDNDGDARTAEWKWWSASGNSWQQPSIFGVSQMSDYGAGGEVLRIVKATSAPVIDGEMDAAWDIAPDFSSNTYVTQENGVPTDWSIYDRVEGWIDMDFDFRVMWDDEFFYFFANVFDEWISTEAGGDWEKDSFELYFDGDNSKLEFNNGEVYDENDKQLRAVYTTEATEDLACTETETGWTIEWRIPYESLNWTPFEDQVIGFEVQLNDQDDPELIRSGMARWWGNDNNAYQDPSLFGDAQLVLYRALGNAVEKPNQNNVAATYKLAQNYPNPFNPSTTIAYSVASRSNVTLTVFNMLGKEVANLVNEVKAAGNYTVNFDAGNLPSGVYFYKLNNGSQVLTQKMMLIK